MSPMFEMIGNTARDAVVGGTISVIGGSKFANGAQTGAFRYLFNEDMYQRYRLLIHERLRFS
jgi:hypothetical protein